MSPILPLPPASRTDTVPDVIHDAAQRPPGRRRSGIVDNSAAGVESDVDKLSPTRRPKRAGVTLPSPAVDRAAVNAGSQPRSVPHQPPRLSPRSPDCDRAP